MSEWKETSVSASYQYFSSVCVHRATYSINVKTETEAAYIYTHKLRTVL